MTKHRQQYQLCIVFILLLQLKACSMQLLHTAHISESYAAPIFIIEMIRVMWQQRKQTN